MSRTSSSALVLQGGGALGAYEYGAAEALYEQSDFNPDLIAGVSIGAITAVLLARPAKGLKPIEALSRFWDRVSVAGDLFPPAFREYASLFGNPNFFTPRLDLLSIATWTSIYDTAPLRRTLSELVDLDALTDPAAAPGLLVSATNVREGQIRYFYSGDGGLRLDHIIASGSLPPSFPMTRIEDEKTGDEKSDDDWYWDGGVFDNTPLGAVLDRLDQSPGVERSIYVVNLFPNKAPLPRNLLEVNTRLQNLQFANKTLEDLKLLRRFDEVAQLIEALDTLPQGNPLAGHPAYDAVAKQRYVRVPNVIAVTRPEQAAGFDASDFSPQTIAARKAEGYKQTIRALHAHAASR
ncbi:MAG TPA: patatin-like phospholipase family protein [Methylocystis sp.]|nr:patatin-like phospholipase family protein [Methylocystis sp.]